MILQQSGLFHHAQKVAGYANRNPCSIFDSKGHEKQDNNKKSISSLRIKDMVGVFYLLCGGTALSLIAFTMECTISMIKSVIVLQI